MGSAIHLPKLEKFYHFGLTFPETDSLRLVLAPVEVIDFTRNYLIESFGLRKAINDSFDIFEFYLILRSCHFPKSLKVEDLRMKIVMITLIKQYYALGWHLKVSMMLHEYGDDTSEIIFEKNVPIETDIMCLSLNGFNKIRIVGPEYVFPIVENAIKIAWKYGIKKTEAIFTNAFEIKLKKDPWYESLKDESKYSTIMMNSVLSYLHQAGWIFIASIRTEPRNENLNALYFRYDANEALRNDSALFALSLHHDNELHLTNAPVDVIMGIKAQLPVSWEEGVEKETFENNIYEFKFNGAPWKDESKEGTKAKRLICDVFSLLRKFNWNYYVVCDLSRHLNKKSTFFVRHSREFLNTDLSETICISLDGYNKMRVINANHTIISIIRNCIDIGWPYSVVKEKLYGCSWQFKLNGYPFFEDDKSNTHVLFIMMIILERLQEQGLVFLGNGSINGDFNIEPDYAKDLHSWYFASNPINYKIEPAVKPAPKAFTVKSALGMFLNYKNYTSIKGLKKLFVDNTQKIMKSFYKSAKQQIVSLGSSVISGLKPAATAANNLKSLSP